MIKKRILLILNILLLSTVFVTCSDSKTDNELVIREKYPLMGFSVKVGNSYYHGKIDQETKIVEIGDIDNANEITEVKHQLINDKATIYPDPSSFVGQWKKEQSVNIVSEDNSTTTYKIVLSDFKDQSEDGNIIFIDNFDTDGIPNPDKWELAKKANSDWNDEMSESYDQAYVKDGNLVLVAEKIDGVYKAGGIETRGKFSFTFGKVEVRARITRHPNGAFPALWLMPQKYIYDGWPYCGEIDMMEHVKQEPNIHHAIHTNYTYNLNIKTPAPTTAVKCDYANYNIYGMEWNENEIKFYVNGVKTLTYPNLKLKDEAVKMQWPFTKDSAFYLILNMGLGGNREGSWAGPIDDNNLPAIMEVDWVKVSKLQD